MPLVVTDNFVRYYVCLTYQILITHQIPGFGGSQCGEGGRHPYWHIQIVFQNLEITGILTDITGATLSPYWYYRVHTGSLLIHCICISEKTWWSLESLLILQGPHLVLTDITGYTLGPYWYIVFVFQSLVMAGVLQFWIIKRNLTSWRRLWDYLFLVMITPPTLVALQL